MKSMSEQLRDLAKSFNQYAEKTDGAMEKAITTASILVQRSAVLLAPVDTGLLRKSIRYRIVKMGKGIIGEVGTNVEYAPFQEFGTIKMESQPFLTPALNMNKAKIKDIFSKAIAGVKA